ncbi:hypothetical protein LguiB_025106 [Lonicera macranthoides]
MPTLETPAFRQKTPAYLITKASATKPKQRQPFYRRNQSDGAKNICLITQAIGAPDLEDAALLLRYIDFGKS